MEQMIAKEAADGVQKAVRTVEAGIKKAWSILEAAEQKKAPSEMLSPSAIQAIQGKTGD
jgi:hypothetical protein